MIRSVASKVMWVGRATVFLVGLAVILAIVFGVVSRAGAHTGSVGLFHLGHSNAASTLSSLVGTVSGGMLQVTNNSTATTATGLGVTNKSGVSPAVRATNSGGGPALGLNVGRGKSPMTVSAGAAKATNLDADKVDGLDSTQFAAADNFKVGQLELAIPSQVDQHNFGTVLENGAFTVSGTCSREELISIPFTRAMLVIEAKQNNSTAFVSPDGQLQGGVQQFGAGEVRQFAQAMLEGVPTPSETHRFGEYVAHSPAGFLNGEGSVFIDLSTNKCKFFATGVGK